MMMVMGHLRFVVGEVLLEHRKQSTVAQAVLSEGALDNNACEPKSHEKQADPVGTHMALDVPGCSRHPSKSFSHN
jgi:hypothetical protein